MNDEKKALGHIKSGLRVVLVFYIHFRNEYYDVIREDIPLMRV